MLVGQHDDGIADLDLGVPDPPVRGRDAHDLLGVEGALIEVDRAGGAVDDQVRGDRVIPGRDRLDLPALGPGGGGRGLRGHGVSSFRL